MISTETAPSQQDSAAGSRSSPRSAESQPTLPQIAALNFFLLSILGNLWSLLLVIYLASTSFALASILVLYICYINSSGFLYACSMGSRPIFRPKWWSHLRDYFPTAKLHKTADLPPSGRYIFIIVPHGILSVSTWLTFCTSSLGFEEQYPGIEVRPVTLDINFSLPFIREYCLACGLRSASRQSIKSILASGPGSAVALVPGGASEALLSNPDALTTDVLTARRKGFIRIALESGASVVPVCAFGENDLWDTIIPRPNSRLALFLSLFKKACGFSTPIAKHFYPKQKPLNVVIGSPVHVPEKREDGEGGSAARVEEMHQNFILELERLWSQGSVLVKERTGNQPPPLRFI